MLSLSNRAEPKDFCESRPPFPVSVGDFVNNSKANPLRAGRQNADFTSDLPFRLLVDSVRDYAIFLLDPEGHVLTWNAGAEFIKGYAKDEILGKHFSVFYLPEAKKRYSLCEKRERGGGEGVYFSEYLC